MARTLETLDVVFTYSSTCGLSIGAVNAYEHTLTCMPDIIDRFHAKNRLHFERELDGCHGAFQVAVYSGARDQCLRALGQGILH